MINTYLNSSMANQLGKANSQLGKIHAGKVAITDAGFSDPMTFSSTFYLTYDRSLEDVLSLNPTISSTYVHQRSINEEPIDFQEVLMFDTDFILSRMETSNLIFDEQIKSLATFNRSLADTLDLIQDISPGRFNRIDQEIIFTQEITTEYSHRQNISQTFNLSQTINNEIRHLWPRYSDSFVINQIITINNPRFVLISKAGPLYILPYPDAVSSEDLNFEEAYKSAIRRTFTFHLPNDQLKSFKHFLCYYRHDPFVINDMFHSWLAYLHHSKANRLALDLYNTSTTVTLDFHLLPLN